MSANVEDVEIERRMMGPKKAVKVEIGTFYPSQSFSYLTDLGPILNKCSLRIKRNIFRDPISGFLILIPMVTAMPTILAYEKLFWQIRSQF